MDSDNYGIASRVLYKNGTSNASETFINTYTTSAQKNPKVCGLQTGGYVVVWESAGQHSGSTGVYARLFDPDTSPAGAEFVVGSSTSSNQVEAALTCLPSGKWVVAYQSETQEGADGSGIYARIFNDDGTEAKSEFHVNTYTTST
eukprot:CAMPEP_0114579270 /NCGR_PEP_ID=MMETSP0125-20121206/3680_1 /TAXON_ID=485358 ORGANISM="Aristerostoma sp., Strain ATCC 50986" /NCGR_SAMPLE_ID=MMETSP0125 /ASSEMBLY_ACC=CAM_ASM_000245 /LENGTH=144 /DNA_ID=CAMNT_0001769913 /DNA_START=239 /DNA_END=673 /DNA_ORIENTATION=+